MNIGKIIAIQYNQFKVKILSEIKGGALNVNGEIYYFGNIGSYLKTSNTIGEDVICEVIAIFDSDTQNTEQNFNFNSNRELLLKPIGIYKDSKFSICIGIYPSLYSDVCLITYNDLKSILTPFLNNHHDKGMIELGVSKNLINYPIHIQAENFFNIHSAVLGNSGSGKSHTIAHILQEVYKQDKPALGSKIIIFDVNGEYGQAFLDKIDKNVKIKRFKPNINQAEEGYEPFCMPHFLLSLDEWCSFLLATDAKQKPFWDMVLQEAYRFCKMSVDHCDEYIKYFKWKIRSLVFNIQSKAESDTSMVTSVRSLISSFKEIIGKNKIIYENLEKDFFPILDNLYKACSLSYADNQSKIKDKIEEIKNDSYEDIINIETSYKDEFFDYKFLKIASEIILLEEETRGNKTTRNYVATMLNRLDFFLENPECQFMRGDVCGIKNKDEFFDYICNENNQMVIIDTSELENEVLETLTSVISRLFFFQRKILKGDERRKNPIHLILDEAHRYIKKDHKYMFRENIFERIAREGRKYSLYLIISSQRPSELLETVLSQCANFIIHRIQNENDMRHISTILPYFSDDLANKIKQSIPGEALVFGNCVPMPIHIKITKANPEPHSSNCDIKKEWYNENSISSSSQK